MNKILETIKKVELELQEEVEKSEKEANRILSEAQHKVNLLEEDFKKKFELEKKQMIEGLNKEMEEYRKSKMNSFKDEFDEKLKLFNEKKDIIKEKVIKLIFDK